MAAAKAGGLETQQRGETGPWLAEHGRVKPWGSLHLLGQPWDIPPPGEMRPRWWGDGGGHVRSRSSPAAAKPLVESLVGPSPAARATLLPGSWPPGKCGGKYTLSVH